jgi:hypothetical protein
LFPGRSWPLCLPLDMQNAVAGSDLARSVWESYPEPALREFPVQPRSLAMFRAEQMLDFPGGIRLVETAEGSRQVVNGTDLELRDAQVVDVASGLVYRLGTLAPGAGVPLGEPEPAEPRSDSAAAGSAPRGGPGADRWLDLEPFLAALKGYRWSRPEDAMEWRLVAWTDGPQPGPVLQPAVDRHRGLRLVLAHLDYGPTPFFDMTRGGELVVPYRHAGPE